MSSKSSKYGSSSGGGDDPFKNNTPSSMSKKLEEPKKKRRDSKKEEEHSSRRRAQNRNSQRAYRERRERRLIELESQVQQAEALNQDLTIAYQELREELGRLEAEIAQEQHDEAPTSQSGPSYDPSYNAPNSNAYVYEQGDVSWMDSTWAPQDWEESEHWNHNPQG